MVTLGSQSEVYTYATGKKIGFFRGWMNFPLSWRAAQRAGTFMQELGHSLGLSHAGATNWDGSLVPGATAGDGYLSVMNYAYQSPGSARVDSDGSKHVGPPILDYSQTGVPDDWGNLWYVFRESPWGLQGRTLSPRPTRPPT
jgi:hypothetical protein